ncbi:hypothetical protein E2C01_065684 [Portunus trituberculatus]|uniref:Uncharacterized protein n=1 Tax=Portunus trituberculatus TaxID=210409 RepID=A0A5B7HQ95_PORTR|nr:hypothetical protein [Portunus trituberculatus]
MSIKWSNGSQISEVKMCPSTEGVNISILSTMKRKYKDLN